MIKYYLSRPWFLLKLRFFTPPIKKYGVYTGPTFEGVHKTRMITRIFKYRGYEDMDWYIEAYGFDLGGNSLMMQDWAIMPLNSFIKSVENYHG